MATLVEIKECNHDYFAKVRSQINQRNRFALSSETFINDEGLARFWFHDAKYIPLWMYRTKNVTVWIPQEFHDDIIGPLLETFD